MDPAPTSKPTAPPSRRPVRPVAPVVAAVSLLLLLASISLLGLAIARYQRDSGRRQYYYDPIDATSFSLGGLPVTIREEVDEQGRGELIVTYAQDELRLRVEIPNPNAFPLVIRHEDWFRLVRWADGTGMSIQEFDAARASGERPEHYVIVTRALGPGAPAGGWGEVWRNEWVFNLYTFLPPPDGSPAGVGGGFERERFEYPESPRAFARRVDAAILKGEPPPERNPRELKEDSWQYGAAMQVMPPGAAPPHTFNRGVLMENRWLVALASLSIIALMFSTAIALAPPRAE